MATSHGFSAEIFNKYFTNIRSDASKYFTDDVVRYMYLMP